MSRTGADALQSTNLPSTGGMSGGQDLSDSSMRNQLRDAKDQVVGGAKHTLFQARDSAASSLNDSKSTLAEQIASVADAFRGTTERLRGRDQHKLADYADGLADQANRFADYLRTADFNAMRRDAEDLARRQPAALVGGAFVLGLLGARFLKSSQRSQRRDDARGFGRTEYGPRRERLGRESYGSRAYGRSAYGEAGYGASSGRSAYGQPGTGQSGFGGPSHGQQAMGEPGYGDVGGTGTGRGGGGLSAGGDDDGL
jgi:hypothetical protein